ncbi:MAG: DUF262 domain-containing protein [Verrucomicrobia bacterium]|nr:DUF262 domain-containing protein [Verrucomicrobiota bacterium]
MRFTPNPLETRSLVEDAEKGKLALPEFQRDFIWNPADVAELLRTIARDWPAGTFLLLEGPQEFACKALDGAPPVSSKPELLILDGQQRMTALYQAMTDSSDEVYYINMQDLMASDQLEDEHVKYMAKRKFSAQFSTVEKMANAGIAPVHIIRDDKEFLRWTRYIGSPDKQDKAFEVRDKLLPGLKSYFMPCVVLPRAVPLQALAKIFETINKTGVRLDAFDLMVAKLYPHEFKLRDRWSEAEREQPTLKAFDISGIEILKLIALREHLREKEPHEHNTVKGVRESDVLALKPKTVIDCWERSVKAIATAIRLFL